MMRPAVTGSAPPRAREGDRGVAVRDRAVLALLRVEAGAHSDQVLSAAPRGGSAPRGESTHRDDALLRELVLGVLRHRSWLDAAIAPCSKRPLASLDPVLLQALRVAAYQMLRLDRVPAPAAVSTAVSVVRRRSGPATAAYANAVLRALERRKTEARPRGALEILHSHPEWLIERLAAAAPPPGIEALLRAHNTPPPVGLRAVPLEDGAVGPPDGAEPSPWLPGAWRARSVTPGALERVREGSLYIQDEASMLVGLMCRPAARDGEPGTVLDLCAAPGGKSLAALERGARVAACDRQRTRLRRLRENLDRTAHRLPGVPAVVLADAARPPFATAAADLVILDAPCSGTGVIRRHPEIRWRLTSQAVAAHAARQAALLRAAMACVAPGGHLIYSVCSVLPEEGEDVVRSSLAEDAGFAIEDPRPLLPRTAHALVGDDGFLRTWPHRDGLDGHCAVRLRRRRAGEGTG